jgi:phosphoglycolate phosphatase-like HAD superfamily hydrolase
MIPWLSLSRPKYPRFGKPPPATEEAQMSKQKLPPGWDEERVREVIAHYEGQTEDEEFAEIEAAREAEDVTLMAIPTELVPEVRALLARKHST